VVKLRESKAINVPLLLQPKNEPFCGPACARMVLAFHGRKITLKKVVSAMKMTGTGVDIATLGNFFLEKDFNVTIEMWLDSFPNRFIGLRRGVEQELLRWCRRGSAKIDGRNKIYRKTIPRFIGQGGLLIPKPVSCQKLRAAIRKRCPPILNLNMATIYELQRRREAGHYVVPTHVAKDRITINDPSRNHGGVKTYPTELILHASYIWSAGAIFIEPK
jgi:hypothetical protein